MLLLRSAFFPPDIWLRVGPFGSAIIFFERRRRRTDGSGRTIPRKLMCLTAGLFSESSISIGSAATPLPRCGGSAFSIRLAVTPLSRCNIGFGIGSLHWVSVDSAGVMQGVMAVLNGQERTDNHVASTDAPPLRDLTYDLLD